MTDRCDYYEALGLDEHAEPEAIKRAYRECARACHPDCHPDDPDAAERFRCVSEAYDVLSDPARRQQYDLLRRHPFNAFGRLPAAASFGPAARATPNEIRVRLTFEQALCGGKTEIPLADGRVVCVPVPKGIGTGFKVRLSREGLAPHNSATRDDLVVSFHVAPDPRFHRDGLHLHTVETISALEAVLGATRCIENAYGQTIKLPIPPGTQPGERFRLHGQGVATPRRTGDLFVEVRVAVPRHLSDEQRAHLRAAAEEAGLL